MAVEADVFELAFGKTRNNRENILKKANFFEERIRTIKSN